jgi:hypothetical protein
MSSAWVVKCKGCQCEITCFAIDPQSDHMQHAQAPPRSSAIVDCPCCSDAFRYQGNEIQRGDARRNPACLTKSRPLDGALLVAATICASIRLQGQDLRPSPKLNAVVSDSVQLARKVLAKMDRDRL